MNGQVWERLAIALAIAVAGWSANFAWDTGTVTTQHQSAITELRGDVTDMTADLEQCITLYQANKEHDKIDRSIGRQWERTALWYAKNDSRLDAMGERLAHLEAHVEHGTP